MSVCLSVCLSVRPYAITPFLLHGFSLNLTFADFSKIVEEVNLSLKSYKKKGTLHEDLNIYEYLRKYGAELLLK
jgi:hypothetical protein